MIAKGDREDLAVLQREYERLVQENLSVAKKLLVEYYPEVKDLKYRGRNRSMKVWEFDINELMGRMVAEFVASEAYFVEKLAKLVGEFEKVRPFGRRDAEVLFVIVNRRLREWNLPPMEKWSKIELIRYKKAVRRYKRWGYIDVLERMIFLKVKEALHRWIAEIGGRKTVPLKRYAVMRGESVNAVRNKARRQTIPAFRKNGKWLVMP